MLTVEDIDSALATIGGEDLLVKPYLCFDKEATHKVSPDASRWDIDALHAVYEAHPFIQPDFQADVNWLSKDEQQGYAVGAVVISSRSGIGYAPTDQRQSGYMPDIGSTIPEVRVAIPVIIKKFEMFPVDVLKHGEHFYPLTDRRLAQAFQARDLFAGVEKYQPSEDGQRSLVDVLAPPYEAAYGNYSRYGGGYLSGGGTGGTGLQSYSADGMGKQAVVLPGRVNTESILNRLLPTLKPEFLERWQRHVTRTPTALVSFARSGKLDILRRAATTRPTTGDDELDWLKKVLPKDLVRVTRLNGDQWSITLVSDKLFDPLQKVVPRERAVEILQDALPDIDDRMRADDDILVEGVTRETREPLVLEDLETDAEQATPGTYVVMSRRGEVLRGSYVEPVLGYDGSETPWGLWSDGKCHAVSDVIIGGRVSDDIDFPEATLRRGEKVTFLIPMDSGYGALLPFAVRAVSEGPGHKIIQGFDLHGRNVNFAVTTGAKNMVSVTGISDPELGTLLDGNCWIVPDDWMIVRLGHQVRLWDNPRHIRANLAWNLGTELLPHGKEVVDSDNSPLIENPTIAIRDMDGRYQLKGSMLEDVTGTMREEDLDRTEAAFLLACLGASVADAEQLLDRASQEPSIRVINLRKPNRDYREKTAELTKLAERWNVDLFLEAAGICEAKAQLKPQFEKISAGLFAPDEESVEAVLGLGFITEDNVADLLNSIPQLQECESKLAELLIYTRLGFDAVPDESVSRALKSFNTVLEELEVAWALMRGGAQPA